MHQLPELKNPANSLNPKCRPLAKLFFIIILNTLLAAFLYNQLASHNYTGLPTWLAIIIVIAVGYLTDRLISKDNIRLIYNFGLAITLSVILLIYL